MAGESLTVDMQSDDVLPPWRTVIEMADIAERLTLVGGLMVAVHARRSGVTMNRPTDDVDVLVDYWMHRTGLADARVALRRIGFDLVDSGEHAYRFVHADGRKVDLMVADHLPSNMRPRLALRDAFVAPAGQQAIRRRDLYTLTFNSGTEVVLGVPDELGALVSKGAAYLVDQRDRNRHLDDAAVLFAAVTDVSAFDYDQLSKNDRRRLRAVLEHLNGEAHPSWVGLGDADRARGMLNAKLISGAMD